MPNSSNRAIFTRSMKKSAASRRKSASKSPSKSASSASGRRGTTVAPEQSEWDFDEVRAASGMPRCEETGVNVDLHLVVYKEPGSNEPIARILGDDYRHLVRARTSLSVPIAILNVASLRQLEKLRKIPLGTRAAKVLRDWLDRESNAAWSQPGQRKQLRQVPLDLPEDTDQPLFQLI